MGAGAPWEHRQRALPAWVIGTRGPMRLRTSNLIVACRGRLGPEGPGVGEVSGSKGMSLGTGTGHRVSLPCWGPHVPVRIHREWGLPLEFLHAVWRSRDMVRPIGEPSVPRTPEPTWCYGLCPDAHICLD